VAHCTHAEHDGRYPYGHRAGSGADEPKRRNQRLGDRRPDQPPERDAAGKDALARDPRSMGKATRGKDEIATRRHLEGSEQGPT
jgi:hypothetical protein